MSSKVGKTAGLRFCLDVSVDTEQARWFVSFAAQQALPGDRQKGNAVGTPPHHLFREW
ncbi:MAG: hypothetical protein U5K77_00410 [Candidatus Saccharibacteria bacterium]|nr:hypothetical protein [Candidatus Saccharibacteria bacterium]